MAIEHKNITEANLHEPKGISAAAAGKAYIANGAGSGTYQTVVVPTSTASDIRKVYVADGAGGGSWKMPTRMGWWDYNDLATATTPITLTPVATPVKLTNDEAGPNTNKTYKLPEVVDIWNKTTNQFDFSSLKIGDTLLLRTDLTVTTASANNELNLQLALALGGTPYTLDIRRVNYKTSGSYPFVVSFSFYIGDANTKDNPAELRMSSDTGTSNTVKVNGWFVEVISRGDN